MREVVHARSIEFLRVRNDRFPSGRIHCDKEIFFPYDRFMGYKKSNQNQFIHGFLVKQVFIISLIVVVN